MSLREELRARLKTLTNTERLRRKRKEKAKEKSHFTAVPYKFRKYLVTEVNTCIGKLECI